jgi:DNA-binding CsgD family transcriptional regulator
MASSHGGRNSRMHPAVGSSNHSASRRPATQHAVTAGEVIVEGRRYRLVPVDEIQAPQHQSVASQLTGRELQIVALVAEGRVNKQIASDLHISEWTVSTHLRRIFSKLGVDTRAAMVSKCAPIPVKLSND